jgi:hypothetical protein
MKSLFLSLVLVSTFFVSSASFGISCKNLCKGSKSKAKKECLVKCRSENKAAKAEAKKSAKKTKKEAKAAKAKAKKEAKIAKAK